MADDRGSAPKIEVGGNFTLGDVSGEVAIGDNITQTIYKDCTFVLPDGTNINGKLWLYTQGFRPEIDPDKIFGRQQEIEKVGSSFKDSSALAITGFSGTGKSTLASMYVDRVEKMGEFAGIYWRKVDETTEFIDIVGSFFTAIGKPIKNIESYKKVTDQINLLFRELTTAPYVLILDGFEILLDPQTNKPLKPGFSEFIEKANENVGRSRFMFTSWECPASERGIRPTFYTIGGLDELAAIKLLRQRGLTEPEDELKRAIELSGGHPLALILLVQLIKEGADTLSGILEDNTLWTGEYGEIAENILDKVYENRLDDDERKMLQYVSIYREPVNSKAIVIVADDPYWTEGLVKRTGLSLTRKSLLQKIGGSYWEESLIMNYSYDKLDDNIERHRLAYQYYFSLPLPEISTKKEDVQSLIEAHYHACMAEDYDVAVEILLNSELYDDLDKWGNYKTLVDLCTGVLPEDHFQDSPLLSDIEAHIAVISNLGLTYYHLGQVKKTIKYFEKALQLSREIGDRQGEGLYLGNLGQTYSDLGQVEKAIDYFEESLEISREIGDRYVEGAHLGNLGLAYYYLGQIEKAIEYYKRALEISKEIGDRRVEEVHLVNLGQAHSDLGRIEEAMEYFDKSLLISKEIGDRLTEGNILGNIGQAYYYLGQMEKTVRYFEEALKISREIGDKRTEGMFLGNLGQAYSDMGQVEKAIEHLEKALKYSRETGSRRTEGVHLGNLGLAYYYQGQIEKAIEYLEKALEISREIGDRRVEGVNLGNLGQAYSDMKDVERAMEYFEEALEISREVGDKHFEALHLGNLGLIYYSLGQVERSVDYYNKALEITKEIGNRRVEGINLGNLGQACQNLGQFEKAIEYYERSLEITKETGDKRFEGIRLGNLGSAYNNLGQTEKAIDNYERALAIGKEIKDQSIISFCEEQLKLLKN